jgi:plastocyanin
MNKALVTVIIVILLIAGGVVALNHKSSYNTNNTPSSNGYSQNSSNNNSSTSNSQTPAAGSVEIKNMMFTPSQITVQKGAKVTWTNNDNVAHTVTDDLSNVGGPASAQIPAGETYSFTFTKTGSFQYHCTIHPSMRGTIVVK